MLFHLYFDIFWCPQLQHLFLGFPQVCQRCPEQKCMNACVHAEYCISWGSIHLQCLGFTVLGQNICLGFRFTSCAFFLCPETLSRQNLKNRCPFGLNFLLFSSPEGEIFPIRKWDKIKKTQTHGSFISCDIDGLDVSSLRKHFHPYTSISIASFANWTHNSFLFLQIPPQPCSWAPLSEPWLAAKENKSVFSTVGVWRTKSK